MNHSLTRRDVLCAAAAGAASLTPFAHAQSTWPAKPVMMVVPFASVPAKMNGIELPGR